MKKTPCNIMTATLMQQMLDFPEQNVKKNSLQSLLYSLHFLDYHTPEVSFTQVLSNTHQTENIKYPSLSCLWWWWGEERGMGSWDVVMLVSLGRYQGGLSGS